MCPFVPGNMEEEGKDRKTIVVFNFEPAGLSSTLLTWCSIKEILHLSPTASLAAFKNSVTTEQASKVPVFYK